MVSNRLTSCLRGSAGEQVFLDRCGETVFLSESRPVYRGSTAPGCLQCEEAIQAPDYSLQSARAKDEKVCLAL